MSKTRHNLQYYEDGIRKGDRIVLAQAITLVESALPADNEVAEQLLNAVAGFTGKSIRIGITGVPGVGKSTFIEAFGQYITRTGKKIAVLTVDPSSQITKGSILGDKTRMEELSRNPLAFIRPTASGDILGGVALKTREVMLLCEAAGYEVIIIETVGVGQSEAAVKAMVDFFLLLMLAGAGDELQGIKKGIMEMADAIAITKADGDNISKASKAAAEYQHALHLHQTSSAGSTPKVLTCSAHTHTGLPEVWQTIIHHINLTEASGYFEQNRQRQNIAAFHEYFQQSLRKDFLKFEKLQQQQERLEHSIMHGQMSAHQAAGELLKSYHQAVKSNDDGTPR